MDRIFEGTGLVVRGDILNPSFSMISVMLILDGPTYTMSDSDTYFSELGLYRYLAGRKTMLAQHIMYMVMNRICDLRDNYPTDNFNLKSELIEANKAARRYDSYNGINLCSQGIEKITLV